jgi:hypothetical protein
VPFAEDELVLLRIGQRRIIHHRAVKHRYYFYDGQCTAQMGVSAASVCHFQCVDPQLSGGHFQGGNLLVSRFVHCYHPIPDFITAILPYLHKTVNETRRTSAFHLKFAGIFAFPTLI